MHSLQDSISPTQALAKLRFKPGGGRGGLICVHWRLAAAACQQGGPHALEDAGVGPNAFAEALQDGPEPAGRDACRRCSIEERSRYGEPCDQGRLHPYRS